MNIKLATEIIFLLCITTLVVTIILSKLFRVELKNTDPSDIPPAMWYIAIISVVLLAAEGTAWYFESPETVPNAKNGFLFGLMAATVGFISDILLLIPHKNGSNILLGYYTKPWYWAAFILILIVCTLVGFIMAKRGI